MYSSTPEDWHEADRARRDERVAIHAAGDFYDLDAFLAGKDALRGFELAEVGDVTGRTLLHLQCHIGLDTLSWARHGAAQVVGLDFSEPAVDTARGPARSLGLPPERAAFVVSDVYDAAQGVPDTAHDIVYTCLGALNRLLERRRWAETAASPVAPGGFLHLAEFHPLTDCLDDETGSTITYDYFSPDPWVDESPGTYADFGAATVHNRSVEWQHTVGEVVSAPAAAGLRIEFLHEHDASLFARYPALVRHADGYYRFPADRPRIPMTYSVRASRPAGG
ncbi:class I SAM-dependent methyltransferase [Streptomyces sp. NPDC055962]|uniref:class I SAM-dependent methyltransferase n=1 Tax=Streptomyces sp. NPDC055962 TaxID=3345667 RepID=UPI0035E34F8D